jgi:hypothetical protein
VFARGTIGDDGGAARTAGCTKCTKDDVGCAGGGGLPRPEPELFLLAGVAVARGRLGEARTVRARAELQAAIAEAQGPAGDGDV